MKTDSFIPGLGGAKDLDTLQIISTEERVSGEVKDRCDEVTSSTDFEEKEESDNSQSFSSLKTDLITGDIDLRHQTKESGERIVKDKDLALASSSLLTQDQDDRLSVHPSLPAPIPPPSVSAKFPSSHNVLTGPQAVTTGPALDVSDVDHRRHVHQPASYPGPGLIPGFLPRPSAQPPPPGTEMAEEEDIDMRQAAKRPALSSSTDGEPLQKVARADLSCSSQRAHLLPPLPPQPPPPLPPLPESVSGGDIVRSDLERYSRHSAAHGPPTHERWHLQEHGHDYDRHRHQQDHYPYVSHSTHRHHHASRHHSPSPPRRYRHGGHSRDERHRRDQHFHRESR